VTTAYLRALGRSEEGGWVEFSDGFVLRGGPALVPALYALFPGKPPLGELIERRVLPGGKIAFTRGNLA